MLDTPAHKEFWTKVDPKLHLKHSSTYRRAKLHLLHDQVKNTVENQIRQEAKEVSGLAFTALNVVVLALLLGNFELAEERSTVVHT